MIRTGQDVFLVNGEVWRVLRHLDTEFIEVYNAEGGREKILKRTVEGVIRGPEQTETEDISSVSVFVPIDKEKHEEHFWKYFNGVENSSFKVGQKVTFKYCYNDSEIDIIGLVLSNTLPAHICVVEWGCGVVDRIWEVPTLILEHYW